MIKRNLTQVQFYIAVVLVFCSMSLQATEVKLNEAYQREYIYLNSQKNNLIESKKKTLNQLKQEITTLESKVENQLAQLSRLESQTESKQDEYKMYQDLIEKAESQDRKIQALSDQASETLKTYGYEINPESEPTEVLKKSFIKAESLLQTIDSVQKLKMDVFDIHGKKTPSDVFQFGLISSMSFHDNKEQDQTQGPVGLLAPAGLGQLKVVEQTKAFDPFNSKNTGTQKFFIYDSINKPFEAKTEKTFTDVLEAGGLIGYVIIVFGLFALFVAIKRILILRKYSFSEDLKHEFIKTINARKIEVKDEFSETSKKWANHPALGPLYSELKYINIKNAKNEAETLILSLDQRISAYGPVLLGIAAVGPLLGLLGTVTGMIATFDVITDIGTGNPKMLSGGISEALVTTEFGLIVAIPCLLLGNWLNSWAKRISKNLFEIYDSTAVES